MIDRWNYFQHWLYRHIGEIGDVSTKHRSIVLLLSVLIFLINPSVKITFGTASIAGMGISVNPAQTIPVGVFLFILLIYRLFAFWATVLIESGTNSKIAEEKALYEFDPSYHAEEPRPNDMEYLIKSETRATICKWKIRQVLWSFFLPSVIAISSLTWFVINFFNS